MSDTIYGGPYEWIHLESELETSRTQSNYSYSSSSSDERYTSNFEETYTGANGYANHISSLTQIFDAPQELAGETYQANSNRLTVFLWGPKKYTRTDLGSPIDYFAFILDVDASIQSYNYIDGYFINRCVWRVDIDSYDETIKTIICNEERIIAYVLDKLSASSVALRIFTIDVNDEINNYSCAMCPSFGQYKLYEAYITYNIEPCVDSIPVGVDNINILLGGSAVENGEIYKTFTMPSLINPSYLNRIIGIIEPTTTTTQPTTTTTNHPQ